MRTSYLKASVTFVVRRNSGAEYSVDAGSSEKGEEVQPRHVAGRLQRRKTKETSSSAETRFSV